MPGKLINYLRKTVRENIFQPLVGIGLSSCSVHKLKLAYEEFEIFIHSENTPNPENEREDTVNFQSFSPFIQERKQRFSFQIQLREAVDY